MLFQHMSHVIVTSGRFLLHFRSKVFTFYDVHSKSIHVNCRVPQICCVNFGYSFDWFYGDFISEGYLSISEGYRSRAMWYTTRMLSTGRSSSRYRFISIRMAELLCQSFLCRFQALIRVCRRTFFYRIIAHIISHPNYKAWRQYRFSRHTIECWLLGGRNLWSKVVHYSIACKQNINRRLKVRNYESTKIIANKKEWIVACCSNLAKNLRRGTLSNNSLLLAIPEVMRRWTYRTWLKRREQGRPLILMMALLGGQCFF